MAPFLDRTRIQRKPKSGFSLVEVLISLAVVALALVAIMGLLAVFIKGTKNVVDREEAMSVVPALNGYLQTQGFDKVFAWVSNGGTVPQLYGFSLVVDSKGNDAITTQGTLPKGAPQMQIFQTTDAGFTTGIATRFSRIYFISLSLSQNVAFHQGVSRKLITPGTWTIIPAGVTAYPSGATDSTFFADAVLPLSVRIYAVSTTGATAAQLESNQNYPIVTYDTSISR